MNETAQLAKFTAGMEFDKLTPQAVLMSKATPSPIFAISAIAGTNTADCLREISRFVPARKKKNSPDQPNDSEQNAVTGEEHRAPAKTWSPLD